MFLGFVSHKVFHHTAKNFKNSKMCPVGDRARAGGCRAPVFLFCLVVFALLVGVIGTASASVFSFLDTTTNLQYSRFISPPPSSKHNLQPISLFISPPPSSKTLPVDSLNKLSSKPSACCLLGEILSGIEHILCSATALCATTQPVAPLLSSRNIAVIVLTDGPVFADWTRLLADEPLTSADAYVRCMHAVDVPSAFPPSRDCARIWCRTYSLLVLPHPKAAWHSCLRRRSRKERRAAERASRRCKRFAVCYRRPSCHSMTGNSLLAAATAAFARLLREGIEPNPGMPPKNRQPAAVAAAAETDTSNCRWIGNCVDGLIKTATKAKVDELLRTMQRPATILDGRECNTEGFFDRHVASAFTPQLALLNAAACDSVRSTIAGGLTDNRVFILPPATYVLGADRTLATTLSRAPNTEILWNAAAASPAIESAEYYAMSIRVPAHAQRTSLRNAPQSDHVRSALVHRRLDECTLMMFDTHACAMGTDERREILDQTRTFFLTVLPTGLSVTASSFFANSEDVAANEATATTNTAADAAMATNITKSPVVPCFARSGCNGCAQFAGDALLAYLHHIMTADLIHPPARSAQQDFCTPSVNGSTVLRRNMVEAVVRIVVALGGNLVNSTAVTVDQLEVVCTACLLHHYGADTHEGFRGNEPFARVGIRVTTECLKKGFFAKRPYVMLLSKADAQKRVQQYGQQQQSQQQRPAAAVPVQNAAVSSRRNEAFIPQQQRNSTATVQITPAVNVPNTPSPSNPTSDAALQTPQPTSSADAAVAVQQRPRGPPDVSQLAAAVKLVKEGTKDETPYAQSAAGAFASWLGHQNHIGQGRFLLVNETQRDTANDSAPVQRTFILRLGERERSAAACRHATVKQGWHSHCKMASEGSLPAGTTAPTTKQINTAMSNRHQLAHVVQFRNCTAITVDANGKLELTPYGQFPVLPDKLKQTTMSEYTQIVPLNTTTTTELNLDGLYRQLVTKDKDAESPASDSDVQPGKLRWTTVHVTADNRNQVVDAEIERFHEGKRVQMETTPVKGHTGAMFSQLIADIMNGYRKAEPAVRRLIQRAFLMAPRMHLRRPGKMSQRDRERFHRSQVAGNVLTQTDPTPPRAPRPNTPASSTSANSEAVDWALSMVKKAFHMCMEGFMSRAAATLVREPSVAQDPATTLENLKKLHPDEPEPKDVAPPSERVFKWTSFTPADIKQTVHRQCNGSTPGPDGWTYELLDSVLQDATLLSDFHAFVVDMCNGDIAPDVASILAASNLTGIPKPCGGTRPIAAGSVPLKIAETQAVTLASSKLRGIFGERQRGVSCSSGTDIIVHRTRLFLRTGQRQDGTVAPDSRVVVTCDFENAFNMLYRSAMWEAMRDVPELHGVFAVSYSTHSKLFVTGQPGEILLSKRGARQGTVCGPAAFALGIQSAIDAACEVPGVTVEAYLDDVSILADDIGRAQEAVAVFNRVASERGMRLKPSKCEILAFDPDALNIPREDTLLTQFQVRRVIRLLGASLAVSDELEAQHLHERMQNKSSLFFQRLNMSCSPQFFTLLRSCGVPRLGHAIRVHAPNVSQRLAAAHDTAVVSVLRFWSDIDTFANRQLLILALPRLHGGMGLTSHEAISAAAYQASMTAALSSDSAKKGKSVNQKSLCAALYHNQTAEIHGSDHALAAHLAQLKLKGSDAGLSCTEVTCSGDVFSAHLRTHLLGMSSAAARDISSEGLLRCSGCSKLFNALDGTWAAHSSSCVTMPGGRVTDRHNTVVKALRDGCNEAQIPVDPVEPRVFLSYACGCKQTLKSDDWEAHRSVCARARDKQVHASGPDICYHAGSKTVLGDVTIVNMLCSTHKGKSVDQVFAECTARKEQKYAEDAHRMGMELQTLSATASGHLGPELRKLSHLIADRSNVARPAQDRKISAIIAHGSARGRLHAETQLGHRPAPRHHEFVGRVLTAAVPSNAPDTLPPVEECMRLSSNEIEPIFVFPSAIPHTPGLRILLAPLSAWALFIRSSASEFKVSDPVIAIITIAEKLNADGSVRVQPAPRLSAPLPPRPRATRPDESARKSFSEGLARSSLERGVRNSFLVVEQTLDRQRDKLASEMKAMLQTVERVDEEHKRASTDYRDAAARDAKLTLQKAELTTRYSGVTEEVHQQRLSVIQRSSSQAMDEAYQRRSTRLTQNSQMRATADLERDAAEHRFSTVRSDADAKISQHSRDLADAATHVRATTMLIEKDNSNVQAMTQSCNDDSLRTIARTALHVQTTESLPPSVLDHDGQQPTLPHATPVRQLSTPGATAAPCELRTDAAITPAHAAVHTVRLSTLPSQSVGPLASTKSQTSTGDVPTDFENAIHALERQEQKAQQKALQQDSGIMNTIKRVFTGDSRT